MGGRDGKRVRLVTNKLISVGKINETRDAAGLRIFYETTHDLRNYLMNLVTLNFKRRPL